MIEEQLAFGNSFIHKMDPFIRILSALILALCAALCENLYLCMAYLGVSVCLFFLTNLNLLAVQKRIKTVVWFLLILWLFLPITFDGDIIYSFYFLNISAQGIILSAKITIKSITILLVFACLIATMTVASFGHGLHRLHLPDKLIFLLLMSYRYIAVIENEYQRLLRAAKFRGFKPGTNLHSYKTFAYLAGMLFVRASLRAERVYQAMLCRGFENKFHTLDIYPSLKRNYFFLFCISIVSAGLVVCERILLVP